MGNETLNSTGVVMGKVEGFPAVPGARCTEALSALEELKVQQA